METKSNQSITQTTGEISESRRQFVERTDALLARIAYTRRVARVIFTVLDYLDGNNPTGQKLTKRWLAQQLGVSEQRVGQILKDGKNLEGETIHRLGEIIGQDLFLLMGQPLKDAEPVPVNPEAPSNTPRSATPQKRA